MVWKWLGRFVLGALALFGAGAFVVDVAQTDVVRAWLQPRLAALLDEPATGGSRVPADPVKATTGNAETAEQRALCETIANNNNWRAPRALWEKIKPLDPKDAPQNWSFEQRSRMLAWYMRRGEEPPLYLTRDCERDLPQRRQQQEATVRDAPTPSRADAEGNDPCRGCEECGLGCEKALRANCPGVPRGEALAGMAGQVAELIAEENDAADAAGMPHSLNWCAAWQRVRAAAAGRYRALQGQLAR